MTGACLGLAMGPILGGWQALVNAPATPLPADWRAVLAPLLPDLPLDDVRLCAPARLPVPLPYIGFTLGRTIFLRERLGTLSGPQLCLIAHELAHVAQFRRLGFARMCAAYGAGLLRHGYADHPMEHEARAIEARVRASLVAAP